MIFIPNASMCLVTKITKSNTFFSKKHRTLSKSTIHTHLICTTIPTKHQPPYLHTQVRRSFIFTFKMLNQSITPYNTEPEHSIAHCISYLTSAAARVYLLQQALTCQTRQFCHRKYSLKVCVKCKSLFCFQ